MPFVLAVLLVAMAASPVALGQKDSGAVAGVVRDSAGAVVPGAKISVKDVDRGTEMVVTTSAQGEYSRVLSRLETTASSPKKKASRKRS